MQSTYMPYNLRKPFFSNRIIAEWNSLPYIIVMRESLTYLKIVWIDYGLIRNLNLVGMLRLPEMEAEV